MKKIAVGLLAMVCALYVSGCGQTHLYGEIETAVATRPSEVTGKVLQVPVALGQKVAAGDVLVVLDDTDGRYAYEQLQQTLVKKQAVVEQLQMGPAQERIRQAQNAIAIAQQNYNNTLTLWQRTQEGQAKQTVLYEKGALSQDMWQQGQDQTDTAKNALTVAAAQLDTAKRQLALLIDDPANKPEVRAALADVALTQSQLAQAQHNLSKYTICATESGTIISLPLREGDLAMAGGAAVDIAVEKERYLVLYVPANYLKQLAYGQTVTISDGEYQENGVVSYLDLYSQLTPKDWQNSANRNQESIKVKIRLAEDTAFRVGQQAELLLSAQ